MPLCYKQYKYYITVTKTSVYVKLFNLETVDSMRSSQTIRIQTSSFIYASLKNGRIMLYPSASVRPSVCKLFRFRVTPPTVYVRLS